ncbi:pirin family protein [Marinobacterium arenosum]|uniref:pirin family protein n=1 Tax=Marinobacterium arenosum TaxID=2862496 RepID=UPI001C98B34D|nr:pirin family protein [Marinobacterium arenosum]MBY4675866.1 pirin family protein [Marinobacterium arenosum]
MSNLICDAQPIECPGREHCPARQEYPLRSSILGEGLQIQRALPHRERRLVGPWCFLDHFGPVPSTGPRMINVAPHPHIGLQTVTWLFGGEIHHLDSLGFDQLIRPGQLNLMTAGRGVAHSEESTSPTGAMMHGVQLWVALPGPMRQHEPAFEHHASVPKFTIDDVDIQLFAGELAEHHSPAHFWSQIVGAELRARKDTELSLPVYPEHEHALLLIDGHARDPKGGLSHDQLLVIGAGTDCIPLQMDAGTRLILIGGEPLDEDIVIWWNFVARTAEEIEQAREAWQHGEFGQVDGYQGEPMTAPPLEGRPRAGR